MSRKKANIKPSSDLISGRVLRSTGSWYEVLTESDGILKCRLRGKFKNKGLKLTNPIAVGDKVQLEIEPGVEEQTAVIKEIDPRENYIIRRSSRNTHFAHIIASNLDQAILIVTLKSPRTSPGFIDRFLVTCEAYDIPGVLVINKMDLFEEEGQEIVDELKAKYEEIGYQVILTSIHDDQSISNLHECLKGKVSLISGHSGVGKSSLINKIDPELDLRTNDISTFSDKGTHTTTFAEMHQMEADTFIVDTPGIKEFGLIDFTKPELANCFPEMRQHLGECKFHNCVHVHEPGCAALQSISEERYYSYLTLLEECEK